MIEQLGFKVGDFFFIALSSILLFFKPMYYSLGFLLIFILLDMVSGLALMAHNKEKFCWRKLLVTVRKMAYFTAIVLAAFMLDHSFVKPAFGEAYIFKMFVLLLAISEFKSILNNFGIVLGIDVWNLLSKALKKKQLDEIIE